MSVLIRGMEMPKCCGTCLLVMMDAHYNTRCAYTHDIFYPFDDKRLPNCPLEEYDERCEDDGR